MSKRTKSPARDLATFCAGRTYVSPRDVERLASDARINAYTAARLAEDEACYTARGMNRKSTDKAAIKRSIDAYYVAHHATFAAWSALTTGERMEMECEGWSAEMMEPY